MDHAIFAAAVIVTAWIFAALEIQIEGQAGWAANLPTWRIQNRLTDLFYGGRPLTGYHLYAQLFVLAVVHLPYAVGLPITLRAEALILAYMILFWILEDFLWFVLNPAFGVSRFKKELIWWHQKSWWIVAPREYFIFGALSLVLYSWGRSLC